MVDRPHTGVKPAAHSSCRQSSGGSSLRGVHAKADPARGSATWGGREGGGEGSASGHKSPTRGERPGASSSSDACTKDAPPPASLVPYGSSSESEPDSTASAALCCASNSWLRLGGTLSRAPGVVDGTTVSVRSRCMRAHASRVSHAPGAPSSKLRFRAASSRSRRAMAAGCCPAASEPQASVIGMSGACDAVANERRRRVRRLQITCTVPPSAKPHARSEVLPKSSTPSKTTARLAGGSEHSIRDSTVEQLASGSTSSTI